MKTATPTDEEIVTALLEGVQRAVPSGGDERNAITFISPAMNAAFSDRIPS